MYKTYPKFARCALAALLITISLGCSSTEVIGPENPAVETNTGGDSFKLTVTTDLSQTCPTTVIAFTLPKADHLYFEVTNATGYHVKTLVDDELEAGAHEVIWDATNDDGEGISSGIYLFHLVTSEYEQWMASVVRLEGEDPEVD